MEHTVTFRFTGSATGVNAASKAVVNDFKRVAVAAEETNVASKRSFGAMGTAWRKTADEHVKHSGRMIAGMKRMAGQALLLGGAFGGFELVKHIIEVSKTVATGQLLIQNATKDSGLSWAENRGQIEKNVVAVENYSGFLKSEVLVTMANLVRSTGNVSLAQKEQIAASDLARGRHLSLTQATTALLRANIGATGALRRYGIDAVKVTTNMDKLKAAHVKITPELKKQAQQLDKNATAIVTLDLVHKKYGGAAAAYMKGPEGASARLNRALENLYLVMAKQLIPALTRLENWLAKTITRLSESHRVSRDLHQAWDALTSIFQTAEGIFKKLWPAIQAVNKYLGGVKGTIIALLAVFVTAKLVAGINNIVKGLYNVGKESLVAAGKFTESTTIMGAASEGLSIQMKAALISTGIGIIIVAVGLLVAYVITHWAKVKKMFWDFADWLKGLFKDIEVFMLKLAAKIVEPFSHIPGQMGQWARDAKKAIKDELWDMQGKDAAQAGVDAGAAFGKNLNDQLNPYLTDAQRKINAALGGATPGSVGGPKLPSTTPKGGGQAGGIMGGKTVNPANRPYSGRDVAGLPGFKEGDIMGAGLRVIAPADGEMYRHSTSENAAGSGPRQLTGYFSTATDLYWLGHLSWVAPLGHYKAGAWIATTAAGVNAHLCVGIKAKTSFTPTRGGGGGSVPSPQTTFDTNLAGATKKPVKVKAIKIPRLSPTIVKELAKAGRSDSLLDDIKAEQDAVDFLRGKMVGAKDSVKAGLETEITKYLNEIKAAKKKLREAGALARSINTDFRKMLPGDERAIKLKLLPKADEERLEKEIAAYHALFKKLAKGGWTPAESARLKKMYDKIKQDMKAGVDAVKAAQQAAAQLKMGDFQRRIMRSISDAWTLTVRNFDRETAKGVKAIADSASADLKAMSRQFANEMKAFDAQTAQGLSDRAAPKMTATEALLAARSDARNAQGLQDTLAAAQAAGDPKAIAQAQYDIETAALEVQAKLERDGADAAAKAAQDAYQNQRDDLKTALSDAEQTREDARQTQADAETQAYQDMRDAQALAMQNQHDDQIIALQNDLDKWAEYIDKKQKSWKNFVDWWAANQPGANPDSTRSSSPYNPTDTNLTPQDTTTPTGERRPGMALGGMVLGRYSGSGRLDPRDTIPTMIRPGEMVLDAKQLFTIASQLPGSRTGGTVTVEINNPTFLTGDKATAASLARTLEPELRRIVSYKN